MRENCARPGCGHEPGSYGADHVSGHLKTGAGCVECPCPAYRTPEQQEAWEEADVCRVYGLGATVNRMAEALERLLELYP
jgi:hypothetical protein